MWYPVCVCCLCPVAHRPCPLPPHPVFSLFSAPPGLQECASSSGSCELCVEALQLDAGDHTPPEARAGERHSLCWAGCLDAVHLFPHLCLRLKNQRQCMNACLCMGCSVAGGVWACVRWTRRLTVSLAACPFPFSLFPALSPCGLQDCAGTSASCGQRVVASQAVTVCAVVAMRQLPHRAGSLWAPEHRATARPPAPAAP